MSRRAQDVLFVLLGVGGLVFKGQYSGPADELVQSYGGNVAASFAVYFLAKRVTARSNLPHASAAALAFMVVQLFELLDGFGLMKNVYDRLDLAANTAGIALAITLDVIVKRISGGRSARLEGSNTESGKARAV
jgi:threonine/homoserine efflux transporter RhtA